MVAIFCPEVLLTLIALGLLSRFIGNETYCIPRPASTTSTVSMNTISAFVKIEHGSHNLLYSSLQRIAAKKGKRSIDDDALRTGLLKASKKKDIKRYSAGELASDGSAPNS